MKKKLLLLALAGGTLPIMYLASFQTQDLLSRAAAKKANLVVDVSRPGNPLNRNWAAFTQGGEEPGARLTTAIDAMKKLSPRYIRLDHIYDFYDVVKRDGDTIQYDFSKLDEVILDIRAMGALPFLSLSYMPKAFTDGSVTDVPKNWQWWSDLVQKTIEHYSSDSGMGLMDVYYEVWNEPELDPFGSFTLGGRKDYRLLYFYADLGARSAKNTKRYFLGGPAVGSYYSDWTRDFVSYVFANNLRLDFYSYHRYHTDPQIYLKDIEKIRTDLKPFGSYQNIPIILSEWGLDSANKPVNNSAQAAAFAASLISRTYDQFSLMFHFEILDGPPPNGGSWGLLTHEKSESPLRPKPRYKIFEALAKLTGSQLPVEGTGTFVTALATKQNNTVWVLINNYDPSLNNSEKVPLNFTNLNTASYALEISYLLENASQRFEQTVSDGTLTHSILLTPNEFVLVNLTQLNSQTSYPNGQESFEADKSLTLSNQSYTVTAPEFRLTSSGSVSFDYKVTGDVPDSYTIFEIPYASASGTLNRLYLSKNIQSGLNFASRGIEAADKSDTHINIPLDDPNNWHRILATWNPHELSLSIDNGTPKITPGTFDFFSGTSLQFFAHNGLIDNLQIHRGDMVIEKKFDESIAQ